jgi:hypothetical protein
MKTENAIAAEETIKMLKAFLYGSRKGKSYRKEYGIRFINVLYSGRDEDKINSDARKNLKNSLKKNEKVDIDSLIEQLPTKFNNLKRKTKAHHTWAVGTPTKKPFKFVIIGEDAPYSGAHLFVDQKGPYYEALKKYVEEKTGNTLREKLQNAETLFIDILTVPLPIGRKLRKQWSWKFKIDGQSLSSVLFELALEHYKIPPKRPTIALMMPPLTADGIIKDAFLEKFKGPKAITKQLVSINDSEKIKEYLSKGIVLSVFSVLAMDRSNSPNGKILTEILKK